MRAASEGHVRFDGARLLELVSPFVEGVSDDQLAAELRRAAIHIIGNLSLYKAYAEPSGKKDGLWNGSYAGFDFIAPLFVEDTKSKDRWNFVEQPQVTLNPSEESVEIYTAPYSGLLKGGGAAAYAETPERISAEGKKLVFSFAPKRDAAEMQEAVADRYEEAIKYKTLMELGPFLDKERRHEDYRVRYALVMQAEINGRGGNANPLPPIIRSGIAPPYGGAGW